MKPTTHNETTFATEDEKQHQKVEKATSFLERWKETMKYHEEESKRIHEERFKLYRSLSQDDEDSADECWMEPCDFADIKDFIYFDEEEAMVEDPPLFK